MQVREGLRVTNIPAALSVFRVGADGKLDLVRKYDRNPSPTLLEQQGRAAYQEQQADAQIEPALIEAAGEPAADA